MSSAVHTHTQVKARFSILAVVAADTISSVWQPLVNIFPLLQAAYNES